MSFGKEVAKFNGIFIVLQYDTCSGVPAASSQVKRRGMSCVVGYRHRINEGH